MKCRFVEETNRAAQNERIRRTNGSRGPHEKIHKRIVDRN